MLHGARDMRTLQEVDPNPFADKYKYEKVPTFNLHSIEAVVKEARKMNPVENGQFILQ